MDINALSELQNRFPSNVNVRDGSLDFMALVAAAGQAVSAPKIDTESMSMTEYKMYIYNIISELAFDTSE